MRLGFILLFIAVPLIELALLIQIGTWLGTLPTIGIIFLTAIIGTAVLQRQGLQTLGRLNAAVARGEPPVEPIIDGVFLLIAGAFLLTPGVLTDAVGGLLLIPPVRKQIRRWGLHKLMSSPNVAFTIFTAGTDQPGKSQRSADQTSQTNTAAGAGSDGKPTGEKRFGDRNTKQPGANGASKGRRSSSSGQVIDGDYERLDERTIDPKRHTPRE